MRSLVLLVVSAVATTFADGGASCVDADWTTDTYKTTPWKVRLRSVQRNGVSTDTGTMRMSVHMLPVRVQDLASLRLESRLGFLHPSTQCGVTACYDLLVPGSSLFLTRK